MLKVILNILLGSGSTGAGFYTGYLYLNGLNEGNHFWLLGLSLILVAFGIYVLVRASRTEDTLVVNDEAAKLQPEDTASSEDIDFKGLLDRNKKLEAEYGKTSATRDKLKLLEIAAAAEEQAA